VIPPGAISSCSAQALYELPPDQFVALGLWHTSHRPAPLASSDIGVYDIRESNDSVTNANAVPMLTLPLPLLACGVSSADNRTVRRSSSMLPLLRVIFGSNLSQATSFMGTISQLGGVTAVWRRAFAFVGACGGRVGHARSMTPYTTSFFFLVRQAWSPLSYHTR